MVFESLNQVLNPVFEPLLKLPILWSIIIISLIVSLIMTLFYKWFTDQSVMKALKDDMGAMQKEIKELSHDPARALDVQKKMMEKNMEYMMHSFKPTLITFIPIILIFGWLSSHLAFMPILPGEEFSIDVSFVEGTSGNIELSTPIGVTLLSGKDVTIENGKAVWTLKGDAGEHDLTFKFKDRTYIKPVLVTSEQRYIEPVKAINDEYISQIAVGNKELIPLNLFGWELGWLGTYIIISIFSSMLLRKLLKVH
ncbi:MAG: EMC3/TMCO1 family protein [Candidatus Woesearchaeota archaeon]|jgi:uncharacterized membrane protein (DUF106 family)